MESLRHGNLQKTCQWPVMVLIVLGLSGCTAMGPLGIDTEVIPLPPAETAAAGTMRKTAPAVSAPKLTPEEIERKRQMALLRQKLQVSKMPDDSLRLGIASDILFEFGSASPRPGARETFAQIAALLKTCDRIAVHVVGHTDNFGDPSTNLWLSQVRAASVAFFLEQNGVPKDRIRFEGRGDREPLESNLTEAGQRINRRVDIVLRPLWPGREQEAFRPPPSLGRR
jgi:outer membrane protein OmpA-like peptidoglycan-associated protein